MNVGSLFSGIGGMDLGLARSGFRHSFFCESDSWRRTVLSEHWPGVPIYEDVRAVGESERGIALDRHSPSAGAGRGEAGIGLLCGGFPCQDVSIAGRRAGLAGERSGLFHEFTRIAESLRPDFILIENVPGLFSSNGGRDFGVVLGTLADIGYGVGWRILDSRFFGVPQRRRRVFILGTLAVGDSRAAAERAGEILAVGQGCPRHPATSAKKRKETSVASLSGLGSGGPDDNDGQGGRLVTALTTRAGNTQDDQQTTQLVTYGLNINRGSDNDVVLNKEEAPPITNSHGNPGGVLRDSFVRRLTPTECERLQSLPDGWTDFGADSRRYAALGDAVTANVAEWIGQRILSNSRN